MQPLCLKPTLSLGLGPGARPDHGLGMARPFLTKGWMWVKKAAENIKTFVEEHWEEFSESLSKLKSEGAIDEQLKLRLKAITQLIESLEDKAVIKNNWVNEFKQYIVNSEDIR